MTHSQADTFSEPHGELKGEVSDIEVSNCLSLLLATPKHQASIDGEKKGY